MKKAFKTNLLAAYNEALDSNRMSEPTARESIENKYGVVFINFSDETNRYTNLMERSEIAEHNQTTVQKLAKEFSLELKADLTEEQLDDCARHKDAGRAHDYVDANMTMDAAFQRVVGREFVFFDDERPWTEKQNEYDTNLINAAWEVAHKHKFFTK